MKAIEQKLSKQLDKLKVFFLKYYPIRIKNVGLEERTSRQIVWDFKDGNQYEEVAIMTSKKLVEQFGEQIRNIVFSCVPASSPQKHELRYKEFSNRVCELSGAINGYDYVKVVKERQEVHKNRKKNQEVEDNVMCDEGFFKGKQILVFDDIITKGYSYANFACKLEMLGANVIGGFFLGKTFYKVR